MLSVAECAAWIGFLNAGAIALPNAPTARDEFLTNVKNSRNVIQWRAVLQARLNYSAAAAGAVATRDAAWDLLIAAAPF